VSEPRRVPLHIVSTSNAADLGFLALADLAEATTDLPEYCYRVIGGHMVQLLQHIYPLENWQLRGTADADAGIDKQTLITEEKHLHRHMLDLGYELESGNRYTKPIADGSLDIDILVPSYDGSTSTNDVAGRAFDSAPGLQLAVVAEPVIAEATVDLTTGRTLRFTVPVPDVEAAVVLKALAWRKRFSDKDVTDLATLFEIVHQHRTQLRTWKLENSNLGAARRETTDALAMLVKNIDRGKWVNAFTGSAKSMHFSAQVRRYTCI
jgi:hypothetical protein